MLFKYSFYMFISILFICGCGESKVKESLKFQSNINNIPSPILEELGRKYIFFGHQSVGANIIEGIIDLKAIYPDLKLNIVEIKKDKLFSDVPSFAHSYVGRNTIPSSKISEFSTYIDKENTKIQIAFLKLCYIDFNEGTDIMAVFQDYKISINKLISKYPNIIFVHFTVPLTTSKPTLKDFIKKMIGMKDFNYKTNVLRNSYNEILRDEYLGKEPIFDIAEIESTNTNGSRTFFEINGKRCFILSSAYSEDGGHLNSFGKKVVSEKLIEYLAGLLR